MNDRISPETATLEIWKERYPEAKALFMAGSIVRGEATAYSDIDIVVVFDRVISAYRRSYVYKGWHVEALLHDPETLNYYLEEENRSTGVPYLAVLVLDGKELPEVSAFSQSIKQLARKAYDRGPAAWSTDEIDRVRYMITDICDDMRAPRNSFELQASAAQLYSRLSHFFFRAQGAWSALGKHIPRSLEKNNLVNARRFESAFHTVFAKNETAAVLALAEEILAPYGGWLSENCGSEAPMNWRKPLV